MEARSGGGVGREKRVESSFKRVLSGVSKSVRNWSSNGISFFFFFRLGRDPFKH